MRKIAFITLADSTIKKVMIVACSNTVYLFLYDAVDDRPCISDLHFPTLDAAEIHCYATYQVTKNEWISISDPLPDCQHDFIKPIRIKDRRADDPKWGPFRYCTGKWIDISGTEKYLSFAGLNGNERLFVAGLLDEFDKAKTDDRLKAIKILSSLGLTESISKLLQGQYH